MIRFIAPAAALMLFAAQAGAQSTTPAAPATTPAPDTSAPATMAPGTMAPGTMAPAAPTSAKHKHSQTLQQRFDAANSSHDGHLTKDQATAAKWGYVTSHFSSIDKSHNGFVTVDDIRAYAKARHAAHHKSTTPAAPATTAPATTAPAPAAPATNG